MVVDQDKAMLLALLNSTPVMRSQQLDELANETTATRTLRGWGGTGTSAELATVRSARADLQAVVRAEQPTDVLGAHLRGAAQVPMPVGGRLTWQLSAAPDQLLAVRAVLAFFALAHEAPGRLRPCENHTCRLFLIDHSRAGTGRWCSMAVCGNRMKARRHASRSRGATASTAS